MADWNKIKTEYITTDTSYRELSQKYGVHYTNIAKRAKKEEWKHLRQQQANTTQTKMIQAVERRKVDRAARLLDVSDRLLQKVSDRVDALDALEMRTQELRQLSATIKDLKEIQMIRSEADIREQEARIEKLRREAQKEEDSKDVKVEMTGEVVEYSG